jgi:hypothetical protein
MVRSREAVGQTMVDKLSIVDEPEISLRTNAADIKTALVKGISGAAPIIGPMLAEALGSIIPDQKINRMVTFVEILEMKVKHLEENVLRNKIFTEEFTDLFEDALNQASRAISTERKEYIATLLKNGLSNDDLNHIDQKKLLSILNELNDAEVIILKFHTLIGARQREFVGQHPAVFDFQPPTLGAGQEAIDKATMRETYTQNLIKVGLLQSKFQAVRKGDLPEFDDRTGRMKSWGVDVTSLGRLLLHKLDILESGWR